MQIASTSYSADDWSLASSRGPVVGDIMWKLGNMLWRIFAQVGPASLPAICKMRPQRGANTNI